MAQTFDSVMEVIYLPSSPKLLVESYPLLNQFWKISRKAFIALLLPKSNHKSVGIIQYPLYQNHQTSASDEWNIHYLASTVSFNLDFSVNLPGLRKAGSSASLRLVAPITTTLSLPCMPSIKVNI